MLVRLLLLLGSLSLFSSAQTLDVASIARLDDFKIDYFYDPSGQKELADIKDATFERSSNAYLFPKTKGAYWVHISICNTTQKSVDRVITLSTNLSDTTTFYDLSPNGTLLRTVELDQSTPMEEKELYLAAGAHKMNLHPNETLELYIRMHADRFVMFGKFLILDERALMQYKSAKDIFHYFYFGVVFAMIVYNLFIYIYYRERIYLYYDLYLIFLNIWFSKQIGVYPFFVSSEYWLLPYYMIPFGDLFFILFTKELLQRHIKAKLFDRWSNAYIILFSLLPLVSLYKVEVMTKLLMVVISTFFIYGSYIVLKGTKKTLPYSIAFGLYMITALNVPLISFGVLPYSELAINANIVGAMIETLMFSIILANRINELKQEKLAIQTEMTTIKENQNVLLREQVAKQTKQLHLLFQELHHRVKNNFQFILTFLWVQKESIKDPIAIRSLQQTTDRIQTISKLHELLNQSGQTSIEFNDYLDLLLKTYRQEHHSVIFMAHANRDLRFDFDTTVTIGLILNELVTNSIKYAFAHTRVPQITITLSNVDDHYTLLYEDNGVGFDVSRLHESSGFGFELIQEFVKKMHHAAMRIESQKGLQLRIDFYSENKDD